MLEVKNVTYYYTNADEALFKNVNLSFEPGNVYSILGSSGSGKTTMLSLIAGLDSPKEGEIIYNDKSVGRNLTKFRRNDISIVFQAYNLIPYLTAFQNIKNAIDIAGIDKKVDIKAVLESVGISEDLQHKKVTKLSGGQQQRVSIARTIAVGHDVIVADEPTGNLDENTTKEVIDLFKKLAHEHNKIVIIVTHEAYVADSSDVVFELKNQVFTEKSHK
ncbi:MAG: ABC transporter ATP-binding protein [Lactobacillales bacterium]|jgi:putative ABC transport system ATP-binding protein|nr:ABC transporter ATP-binding protein [Lactobacillales bacterium]